MKEETKSLPIPEGWEFAGYDNGEIKIRRVEPVLPTTYEEAVDVINYDILTRMLVPQNMSRPITALCNLLIMRGGRNLDGSRTLEVHLLQSTLLKIVKEE